MSAACLLLAAALAGGATNGTASADAASATNAPAPTSRITSDLTYYDRKEGLAIFKGHVRVDDSDYQLHASRAYVFMTGSNTLSRIAATGAVALTNGTKRAYGTKVTYHHENGLVVLHGEPGRPAVVVDETSAGPRTVEGSRIRFWINSEQVEVLEATMSAPRPEGGKTPFILPGSGKK